MVRSNEQSPDRPCWRRRISSAYGLASLLAFQGCGSTDTSPPLVDPPAETTIGVAVSPAQATLTVDETLVLTATALTSRGTSRPATDVTWTSADTAVAIVSSTGVVRAIGAGTTSIAVSSQGFDTTASISVSDELPAHAGRFVSPIGKPTAVGTLLDPWDLATAFGPPDVVQPGDTIWLRNGIYPGCYTSHLVGSAGQPVVVRAYPGEHVVIDGAGCEDAPLTVFGAYTWYWGFEVRNSSPLGGGGINVNIFGSEVKAINLVVHDAAHSGIGFWSDGQGGEVYGSVIFNNGTNDNLDHGIYTQNATGTKRVADNLIFNNWAYGIHAYGSSESSLRGFDIEGNAIFNNGPISGGNSAPNILVGGGSTADAVVLKDNMTYHDPAEHTNVRLGYDANNLDIVVEGNRFVGGSPVLQMQTWTTARVSGNVFVGSEHLLNLSGDFQGYAWSGNRQFSSDPGGSGWLLNDLPLDFADWATATGLGAGELQPTPAPVTTEVIVRPNQYERGRANIVVYNWGGNAEVTVDVSGILTVGDLFEVRNAQTYFATPVLRGRYLGGTLTLPTAAVTATPPLGRASSPPPPTGPRFNAFILLSGRGIPAGP